MRILHLSEWNKVCVYNYNNRLFDLHKIKSIYGGHFRNIAAQNNNNWGERE